MTNFSRTSIRKLKAKENIRWARGLIVKASRRLIHTIPRSTAETQMSGKITKLTQCFAICSQKASAVANPCQTKTLGQLTTTVYRRMSSMLGRRGHRQGQPFMVDQDKEYRPRTDYKRAHHLAITRGTLHPTDKRGIHYLARTKQMTQARPTPNNWRWSCKT